MRWTLPNLWRAVGLCFVLLVACAEDGAIPEPSLATAAATGLDFQELLAADWELQPGTEQYLCARQTVPATMFVGAWRGISPVGTHHVALTVSAQPDGEPDG